MSKKSKPTEPDPDKQTDAEAQNTASDEDKNVVEQQISEVKDFLGDVTLDNLKSGDWFVKLLAFSLGKYTTEVDADFFRRKYPHLPPDAIVDARIQMTANYASIEGGLSAAVYTGAIAATIGSGGGASPLTLPASGLSFAVDLSYTSYLQLRLAYDIAVLYGIPLDMNDPDDLWKLVRVAFAIKAGEGANSAVMKGVPAVLRPMLKKIFSGQRLKAVQALPVFGKYLLQRNIIKFGIPVVSIPLSTGVNYWSTRVAGKYAREAFRREARIIEQARRTTRPVTDYEALMWAVWLIAQADKTIQGDERLFLHHLTRQLRTDEVPEDTLKEFRSMIDVDEDDVWKHLDRVNSDRELKAIYKTAVLAAAVDGKLDKRELELLKVLAEHCHQEFDPEAVLRQIDKWSRAE